MTTILGTPKSKNRRWAGYLHRVPAGVAWLGDIPSHWTCQPLRRFIKSMCDGPFGSDMKSSHYADSGVRLLRLQNVGAGFFDDADRAYVPEEHFASLPGHDAVPGDVIIAGLGDANHPVGRACMVPEKLERAMVKADCFRVRLDQSQLSHSFLVHFLCSHIVRAGIAQQTRGATRERMNLSGVAQLHVPVPPLDEQQQIVAFLDRETAKIDALIAKKQRLIELLLEKRTALISHAVTKGLDPGVPMKESEEVGLASIPLHWRQLKLKHACSLIKDGTHLPPQRTATGYPLLSVRNIVDGKFVILPDDSMIADEDFFILRRALKVQRCDVLLAIVGATLGKVAIVQEMPPFAIQRSLAVLRPRYGTMHHEFLALFLRGHAFQRSLWSNVGYSAQPGIYLAALASFPIVAPPLDEQLLIVEHVKAIEESLDRLSGKANEGIAKLLEYRTALISAAVTGKIDVRGEVG
jgi:type I restriction enzyme, S subunit